MWIVINNTFIAASTSSSSFSFIIIQVVLSGYLDAVFIVSNNCSCRCNLVGHLIRIIYLWMHLAVGYLCHTLSVISNHLFFNRPWFMYNTKWCRLVFLQFFLHFSVDASCTTLFISYFVGSFQSLCVWQELSRLSLLSCFLSFGVSTSGSLLWPVLMKLYFPCPFIFILYGLQLIHISLENSYSFIICGWLFSIM